MAANADAGAAAAGTAAAAVNTAHKHDEHLAHPGHNLVEEIAVHDQRVWITAAVQHRPHG